MVRLILAALLIVVFLPAPALAHPPSTDGPDDPRVRRSFQQSGKTALWFTLGGNRYTRFFDDGGDPVAFGNGIAVTRLKAHVGASRTLLAAPLFSFSVGADVGFAHTRTERDEQVGSPLDLPDSAFDAERALVYGEVDLRYVSARLGYQFDLGPGPFESGVLPSSDNQDAVFVSVMASVPVAAVRLFAGFDSYVTTPQMAAGRNERNEPTDFEYDLGDHVLLRAGGGYTFGAGEIGLAVLFRFRSKERYTLPTGDSATGTSGRHLSVLPYAALDVPRLPVSLHARLAIEGEYGEYGFALAGENESVTRASLTLGAVYAF